ncbi:MAG: tetratricopeptide repeat protein [Eubacteriales bacterium]|nr:tetratricopeptide repeat protein [Eubacteriales bacterium]
MKTFSVFLASSIVEFKNDRLCIGDYIRRLNDELFPKGMYINLVVCEEMSNALHVSRKQSEYNERIKECDFFYILIGKKAGGYTVEEYEIANAAFINKSSPKIRCFFRNGNEAPSGSAAALIDRIREDGYPVMDFPDADSIIADLDKVLRNAAAEVQTENGQYLSDSTDHISILLAMPEHELKSEQVELSDFVRCLNDEYYPKGIYFDLTTFKDLSSKAESAGSQDFFYIVFRKEGDDEIIRSFDTAKEAFMRSGNPRIYTFFETLPSGESPSEGVKAFMNRLDKELGHFYTVFPNIDSLKLNMLIEITRFRILSESVSVSNGSAYLNGKEFLELGNIPAFSRNGHLHAIKTELSALIEMREDLQDKLEKDEDDTALRQTLSDTSDRIEELSKEIHDLENNILEMFSAVAERNSSGKPITWREKQASRYLDEGNYDAALAILRDRSREEELARAVSVKEKAEDAVMGYINEDLLRIRTLMAKGLNQEAVSEVYDCYERCVRIAKEQKLDPGFLWEYLDFLKDQKDYTALVENGEWLIRYHEFLGVDKSAAARCYRNLAQGYRNTDRFGDSIKMLEKSIAIWEELIRDDPGRNKTELARCYGNLSNVYSSLNDYAHATDYLIKAFGLFRETSLENPTYEADLAKAQVNLALLYTRQHKFEASESLYGSAIKIWEKLVEDDPAEYSGNLALAYHNLAVLNMNRQDCLKAEEISKKAVSLRTELAKANPAAYESALASSYALLGNIYKKLGRYPEAEANLARALFRYERLAKEHPSTYDSNLARIHNDIGNYYFSVKRYPDAVEHYKKALTGFEHLAANSPTAYESQTATVFNNLAKVYDTIEQYDDSEDMYNRAVALLKKPAQENPRVFGASIAAIYRNLAALYRRNKKYVEAEKSFADLLAVMESFSGTNSITEDDRLGKDYDAFAEFLSEINKYEESEEYYRKSLGIYWMLHKEANMLLKDEPDKYDRNLGKANNNLALCCQRTGKYAESEDLFKKAIAVFERLAVSDSENNAASLAMSCRNLAKLYEQTGHPDEAESYKNKADSIREET